MTKLNSSIEDKQALLNRGEKELKNCNCFSSSPLCPVFVVWMYQFMVRATQSLQKYAK